MPRRDVSRIAGPSGQSAVMEECLFELPRVLFFSGHSIRQAERRGHAGQLAAGSAVITMLPGSALGILPGDQLFLELPIGPLLDLQPRLPQLLVALDALSEPVNLLRREEQARTPAVPLRTLRTVAAAIKRVRGRSASTRQTWTQQQKDRKNLHGNESGMSALLSCHVTVSSWSVAEITSASRPLRIGGRVSCLCRAVTRVPDSIEAQDVS